MSFKCLIGIHHWDGCICTDCNKIRSTNHDLKEDCEKCSRCGTEFKDKHDWSKDCEKCAQCGKTREYGHSWQDNCEKCSKCGKTRTGQHKIKDGVCTVCGHGIFEDGKKQYKIISIGEHIMMAENYAKEPDSGAFWVYENENSNITKYGYLYDFDTASALAPKGWHLPSKAEWESVVQTIRQNTKDVCENMKPGGHSGFNAVLAGWRSNYGNFIGEHASAHFWSSTQDAKNKAWQFKIITHDHKVDFENSELSLGLSVRYFKDKD